VLVSVQVQVQQLVVQIKGRILNKVEWLHRVPWMLVT